MRPISLSISAGARSPARALGSAPNRCRMAAKISRVVRESSPEMMPASTAAATVYRRSVPEPAARRCIVSIWIWAMDA